MQESGCIPHRYPLQAAEVACRISFSQDLHEALDASTQQVCHKRLVRLQSTTAARHSQLTARVRGRQTAAQLTATRALLQSHVHFLHALAGLVGPHAAPVAPGDPLPALLITHTLDPDGAVTVGCLRCALPYSNEYLGSAAALPVTPQTHEAQLALLVTRALGGAGLVLGPPGTPGTALVADAARCVGAACLPVPCGGAVAERLDGLLRGVLGSGLWVVLEELGLLPGPVLQGLAGLLQPALEALHGPAKLYKGVPIRKHAAVFATMAVGAGGSLTAYTPLPDALRALLRPKFVPHLDLRGLAYCLFAGCGCQRPGTLARRVSRVLEDLRQLGPDVCAPLFGVKVLQSVEVCPAPLSPSLLPI